MAETDGAWDGMPTVRSRKRRVNAKFLVGGVILALAVAYLVYTGLQSSSMYYLTIAEVQAGAANDSQVRVNGKVVAGSIDWDAKTMIAHFTIADGPATLPVVYKGTLPDAFVPDADVIVEGRYVQGQPFDAKDILTKCPSKYEPARSGQTQ